jgi:GGDEF-like domain
LTARFEGNESAGIALRRVLSLRLIDAGEGDPVAWLADRLEADLDSILQAFFAQAQGANVLPELSAASETSLKQGLEAGIRDALERLRHREPHPTHLPIEVDDLARVWAQQSCDLASLIDVVDLARDVVRPSFERYAEEIIPDAEARWLLMTRAERGLVGWIRAVKDLLRRSYEAESKIAVRRRRDDRSRRVAEILAGRVSGDDGLGYDLSLEHLAVIAWNQDAAATLKALARYCARQLLIAESPDGCVWGWCGAREPLTSSAMSELVAWQDQQAGYVAVGEPAAGVGGFRRSHEQANEARKLALILGKSVVRYDDIAVITLALRDRTVAAAFVARELGELASSEIRTREWRETLRVFLENGQSVTATQALRGLNRSTVRHHLDMAQKLLRYRIAARSAELLVALRLAPVFEAGEASITAEPL